MRLTIPVAVSNTLTLPGGNGPAVVAAGVSAATFGRVLAAETGRTSNAEIDTEIAAAAVTAADREGIQYG